MNLLDVLLLAPLAGFLLLLLLPKEKPELIRSAALGLSGIVFGLSLVVLVITLQTGKAGDFVLQTNIPWVSGPAIRYHVGVDGINVWLVLLSTLLTPLAILASWNEIQHRAKEFYAQFLLLEFALIGVFISLDLFLFYVFFELTLIPILLLMGIWGGGRRIPAALKFFLFTLGGSLLMLGSMIYLYTKTGTFDVISIQLLLQTGKVSITPNEAMPMFLGFFLAFAIKLGLFPLHTWLPDAYAECPTGGTLMLAAVMSKMGTYGLLRFAIPLFPAAARYYAPVILTLAVIGIIYGAMIAIVQPNIKRLIAYSSVSHIGFIVLGLFSFRQIGFDGAVYQMLNHGISTGALFLLCGFLYERRKSLDIADFGGVATPAPWLATVFLVASLASMGLPSLNNFIGEYLILQGMAESNFTFTAFAAVGVILSACYMLWMYQRTFLGERNAEETSFFPDLSGREWGIMIPLLVLMVWMGTATQTFLPSIGASNARTIDLTEKNVEVQVKKQMPAPVARPVEVARER